MIDLHNHMLFNLDDGSSDIQESITIAKKLSDLGFKAVVVTPHYIKDSIYKKNNKEKREILKLLEEETKKQNIDMKYYLGNEIYINGEINELIDENECMSINNTKYLLVEFPFETFNNSYIDYLYDLVVTGYKVIIAHAERYTYFQNNIDELSKLKEMDNIYIQCNYSSISGKYGKGSKKIFKKMLKKNMVDFLGTDVHKSDSDIFKMFEKSKKRIIRIVGKDKFNKMSNDNLISLLCDKNIGEDYEQKNIYFYQEVI